MAITAYTGLPGSGKSYSVVENVILPSLRKSIRIFTNIPLSPLVEEEFPGQVTTFENDDIKNNPEWFQSVFSPGATLVIDECWRLWPSGLRANNMIDGHKSFLAEHRHMVGPDGNSTNIILVTQDLGQLANYPRSLVETTYRTVKLVAIGMDNRFRVDVYQGAVTGNQPPEKQRLRQIQAQAYKTEIYKYYKSHTMSDTDQHGQETRIDDRTNILKSPFFIYGLPGLAIVVLIVIYYGVRDVKEMYDPTTDTDVSAPVAAPVPKVEATKKADNITWHTEMSAAIVFNMGTNRFNTEYRIRFANDQYQVTLNKSDLRSLGYTIRPIDPCLVELISEKSSFYVFCERPEQNHSPQLLAF